jgi:hypothetical protein
MANTETGHTTKKGAPKIRLELATVLFVWRTTSSSMLYVTMHVPIFASSVPYAATYVPARLQILKLSGDLENLPWNEKEADEWG